MEHIETNLNDNLNSDEDDEKIFKDFCKKKGKDIKKIPIESSFIEERVGRSLYKLHEGCAALETLHQQMDKTNNALVPLVTLKTNELKKVFKTIDGLLEFVENIQTAVNKMEKKLDEVKKPNKEVVKPGVYNIFSNISAKTGVTSFSGLTSSGKFNTQQKDTMGENSLIKGQDATQWESIDFIPNTKEFFMQYKKNV